MQAQSIPAQDPRTAHLTDANVDWYAARTTAELQAELRGARKALALAIPNRDRSLRARTVCESNERAIPALEALIEARS